MKYILLIILLSGIVHANCSSNQIDINSASIKNLDKITWVGKATAEKIIDARPFEKVDELIKVKGIGEIKIKDILEEGLACVENKTMTKYTKDDMVIKEKNDTKIKKEISVESKIKKTAKLETNEEPETNEELIYASKNSRISSYLPYAFCAILITIIGILIWQRF